MQDPVPRGHTPKMSSSPVKGTQGATFCTHTYVIGYICSTHAADSPTVYVITKFNIRICCTAPPAARPHPAQATGPLRGDSSIRVCYMGYNNQSVWAVFQIFPLFSGEIRNISLRKSAAQQCAHVGVCSSRCYIHESVNQLVAALYA